MSILNIVTTNNIKVTKKSDDKYSDETSVKKTNK